MRFRTPLESLVFRALVLATLLIVASVIIFRAPAASVDHGRGEIGQHPIDTGKQEPSYADKVLDPISLFTLALVISTTLLWFSTEKLARLGAQQSRDMKTSLEISKQAADALTASERGNLIERISIVRDIDAAYYAKRFSHSPTMPPSEISILWEFNFKNYGKTPATITAFSGNLVLEETAPEFDKDFFRHVTSAAALDQYTISGGDSSGAIVKTNTFSISWDQSNRMVRGTLHFWFIGHVVWEDVFQQRTLRFFVWKYDRRVGAFKPFSSGVDQGES